MESYDKLLELVTGMKADCLKFGAGNRSAGTRMRKDLMEVAKLAKSMRQEITDIKNQE